MAPCFADTNDLALDLATTAEDTQHTLQSIFSHTGSVFLFHHLSYCLSISHTYLSLSFHFCHQSFLSLPPVLSYMQSRSVSFTTQILSIPPISLSLPLIHSLPVSIIHSVHLNLFLSISLFFFFLHPSFPPLPSLSLSAQPAASLSLGRCEQCQPTWGPSAVPAEKAGSTREHP